MRPDRFAQYMGRLGPEPLEADFTPAALGSRLAGSRQAVKKVIMDQTRLAGVGNIYANEALWRAGIDPSASAHQIDLPRITALHRAIVDVLSESIAVRGTSARDYRDAFGERGDFANRLDVYGRAPASRAADVAGGSSAHTAIDGRSSVLCTHCQR